MGAAAIGGIGLLIPELAGAQTPEAPETAMAPITLELPECATPPYDTAHLLDKLRLELELRSLPPIIETHSSADTGPKHVVLILSACSGDAMELTLRATDRDSRSVLQRTVSLSDIHPEARARTLALVIAEALSLQTPSSSPNTTSSMALPFSSSAADAASALTPDAPAISGSLSPRAHLAFSTQVRSPLLRAHRFWGAELGARMPVRQAGKWSAIFWAAEAAYGLNTTVTRLGKMDSDWWSGSLGLELSAHAPIEVGIGPRVSLAYVSARPAPPSLDTGSRGALLFLLGGRASLGLPLGGAWLLRGTFEIGKPVRGLVLTAAGDPSLTIDGWVVSSGLGVAVQP